MEKRKEKSAKVNYLYNVAYQVLNVLMPLVTAPYLSRVIGPDGIGVYTYTNSIAGYFAMAGLLGLTNYGSRTIAQCKHDQKMINRNFSGLLYLQLSLCFIVSILYAIYLGIVVKENILISWIQIFVVLSAVINLNWFFWGIEEFKLTVTRSFIIKIINFICIFAFVKEADDLWKYVLLMAGGTFIGQIPLVIIARKYVKLVRVSFKEIIHHFKPNLILFIPILSTTLYRSMNKVALGALTDYSQVGYYENADKIIVILLGCITALGQVMMPKASSLIAKGEIEKCNKLVGKSFNFTVLFSSAIVFGVLSIVDIFVPVFFGNDFLRTKSVLVYLAVSFLFLALSNVLKTQVLMAREKDHVYIVTTMVGAGINLVLNFLLIPLYKADGAAIATLVTEIVVFTAISISIRDDLDILGLVKDSSSYIMVGLIMMVTLNLIKVFFEVNVISLLMLICIGAFVFALGCLVLVKINKDSLLIEVLDIIFRILRIGTKK